MKYSFPQPTWELKDWLTAAGLKLSVTNRRRGPYALIAKTANNMGILPYGIKWTPTNVRNWTVNTSNRQPGIPSREDAIAMIRVLRHIAAQNQIALFDNHNFDQHSRIFLESKAGKYGPWMPLTTREMWQICSEALPSDKREQHQREYLREIRHYVVPPPPPKLFGRANDLTTVQQALDGDGLITVIDAPGGEGKTALAWETISTLWYRNRFHHIAWTTDKRRYVVPDGSIVDNPYHTHDLAFEAVLHSMVEHFEWSHLLGVTDLNRLEAGCAEALRRGRYLVVIDNLETVDAADALLHRMEELLKPPQPHIDQPARVLVTSREWIDKYNGSRFHYIRRAAIRGIDTNARIPFLRYLYEQAATVDPHLPNIALTDQQLQQLSYDTHGNPLMMQIAVQRYLILPNPTSYDEIIAHLESGEDVAFERLFGDLVQRLEPKLHRIAQSAATEAQTTKDGLIDIETLYRIWQATSPHPFQKSMTQDLKFHDALRKLQNNRIMEQVNQSSYTMHPLIQRYLLGR